MAANRSWTVLPLGAVTAATACVASNWPSFSATLGPIDDHEVVRWQGRDGTFGLGEALRFFPNTEWRLWGLSGRYRPTYFLSRLIEASLFGRHPARWYVFHTLLQTAVVVALVVVCHVVLCRATETSGTLSLDNTSGFVFHAIGIAVFAVLLAGMPFWNDVVTRLGPSEIYAMVGLAMGVAGIAGVLATGRRWWWMIATTGFVAAFTSKENMPLLLLPVSVVALHEWRGRRYRPVVAGSVAMMGATAFVVVGSVTTYVVREGHDVYDVSAGRDRWSGALDHWRHNPWVVVWMVAFLVLVWAVLRSLRSASTPSQRFLLAGISATLPLVRLGDAFFTAGKYSLHRYQILQNVCGVAEVVIIVMLGALTMPHAKTWSRWSSTALSGILVAVLALPLQTASSALVRRHHVATVNRDQTRAFRDTVDTLSRRLRRTGNSQLVFVIDYWAKVEPATSMSTFLRSRGIPEGRVFLRLVRDETVDPTPGESRVRSFEVEGRVDYGISPMSGFSQDAPTTCVFVYQTPIDTPVAQCDGADRISFFDGDWWAEADR